MYYLYDDDGWYTGTSETQVANSTAIPYPEGLGFYRFVNNRWAMVFSADINGDLQFNPAATIKRPVDTFQLMPDGIDVRDLALDPAKPNLSNAAIDALFVDAEAKIRATAFFQNYYSDDVEWSYVTYRRGDDDYYSVGISWDDNAGRHFNAKVTHGVITDFYEIFPDQLYVWKEMDPVTFEPVALYTEQGAKKFNAQTLELMQINVPTIGTQQVPRPFLIEMISRGFKWLNLIWFYSNKPYGEIVTFRYDRSGRH